MSEPGPDSGRSVSAVDPADPAPPEDPSAAARSTDASATSDRQARSRLISSGAVMAAGTAVSRVLGFGRFVLLVILFGNGTRQADMFTLANTVPNSMYILLAGGVLNTVLVPQIVRAVKKDADRGEAYTNRIMTLGLMALFVITLALTLAAPAVIALYSAGGWKDPVVAAQYQSMVALAYYCMPQVFFYGAFVLAGQVLNSRDRFGPMMWAPIANNVVSIGVLLLFLVTFGQTDTGAAFTPGQEALLGIGSTVGVAAQAAILVPYLRSSGYHFQPRFDFRHTGLGHTLRLAKWVLGYVLVTQLALIVVNKVATAATIQSGRRRRAGRVRVRVRDLDPAALADHRLAGHGDAAERLAAGRGRGPARVSPRRRPGPCAWPCRCWSRPRSRSSSSGCRSPGSSSASARAPRTGSSPATR